MDNQMMIFENKEVEVFELDGKVYFNPYHVGACLGLSESAVRNYLSKMNEKQSKLLRNSDVHSKDTQNSDVNLVDIRKFNNAGEKFLTESGVYKLVFKSRKPKAEKFTDWVTDEVLPSIKKEGKYVVGQIIQETPKDNKSDLHKEKLDKAIITSNYLIDYVKSMSGYMPNHLLESFTTAIHAVNIDIVDSLKKMNKFNQPESRQ